MSDPKKVDNESVKKEHYSFHFNNSIRVLIIIEDSSLNNQRHHSSGEKHSESILKCIRKLSIRRRLRHLDITKPMQKHFHNEFIEELNQY